MTEQLSILITIFVHIIMRTTVFLEQPLHDCSPAPNIASWIFLISILSFFSDMDFYPYSRSTLLPFKILFESVMCILLVEVATIIVWCSLERIFYKLIKCILLQSSSNMYYDMGGDALVGLLLTGFSGVIFMSFLKLTEYDNFFKKRIRSVWKKISEKIQKYVKTINGHMSKSQVICQRPELQAEVDREDGWCFGNVNPPAQNTRRRSAMANRRHGDVICQRNIR